MIDWTADWLARGHGKFRQGHAFRSALGDVLIFTAASAAETPACIFASARRCPPRSVHAEQVIDAPRIISELLVRFHVECARMRQLDAEISAMRAGPAVSTMTRVPRNTASVIPCVTNRIVLPDFLPDAQQFQIHLLAGQRIEGAERLIHQDQLRIVHQRAGD